MLIVEDNEATSALVAAVLHRDFSTESAADGIEAIEKLKTRSYAAVVLDLRMPGSDGFDVLDFLRASSPDVLPRVVIMTASVARRDMERLRDYPVGATVTKPFEVDALLETVKRCAGEWDGPALGPVIYSSTGVILLIADLLRSQI